MGKIITLIITILIVIVLAGIPYALLGAWIFKWLTLHYFINYFHNPLSKETILLLPYWGFYVPMSLIFSAIASLGQSHVAKTKPKRTKKRKRVYWDEKDPDITVE
jgi:hypothetical protein